jgi:hypothetical protein
VKGIVNQHAQDGLVDYQQRRALLADWGGIDIETWYLLQPRSWPIYSARRRNMPVRRAHASVWLWCQLTSGHERAAPIELPTENLARHAYFIRDVLPPLRERLLILAELLLATPADARSTLPSRLAAVLQRRGHLAEHFLLERIDPLIATRVLAHISAHTGVDIPSLTTPASGSDAPPEVTHARLLAARLLRCTALAFWLAVAAVIGGHLNTTSQNDRRYRAALTRSPPSPPSSTASSVPSRTGTRLRQHTLRHRTTSGCATSRSRSRPTPSKCSPPRTDRRSPASQGSQSAANTPTSPTTKSARSMTSTTLNPGSRGPPPSAAVTRTQISPGDTAC